MPRLDRGILYAAASPYPTAVSGILDRLLSRTMTASETAGLLACGGVTQAATAAGIGSAVTDLIFSIAKREVTFLSGTALISFL